MHFKKSTARQGQEFIDFIRARYGKKSVFLAHSRKKPESQKPLRIRWHFFAVLANTLISAVCSCRDEAVTVTSSLADGVLPSREP
mmetsp:Transcript_10653/g.18736  ORF Transcript_10653/g.18736 Transcript_10653/m.18736 type:complete len:85 (+) Transcript_10653:115-369(+)